MRILPTMAGLPAAPALRILFLLLALFHLAAALEYVQGSKCADACDVGNIAEDAVCLDAEYKSEAGGQRVERCVGCLLNSTAVDTETNTTDVEWGLCMDPIPL